MFDGEGVAEPEWNVPFSAFRWRDVPERGVDTLVSFGVSRHILGRDQGPGDGHRHEIVVALRRSWEAAAMAILVSTGAYVVDRHVPLHAGETIGIPAELQVPVETLAVYSGDELVPGLGTCTHYDPPVEILWLSPVGTADRFDLEIGRG